MPATLISIDLGTTRLKVSSFSTAGRLLAQVVKRHAAGDERADGWWRDTTDALRRLDTADVLGISLSGRAGVGVFVDRGGNVLADAWSDDRHAEQLARLRAWRTETGRPLSNYGAALVAKYAWLREHAIGRARRCRLALYGKDFLLFRLTGAHCTDWSSGPDASAWDAALVRDWDLPAGLLPRPALPWQVAGRLTGAAARETGLAVGTPVAVGAHDGVCANVGAGAIGPGDYAITLGTHAVTRTISARAPAGATRFYAMPPDRHVIGGNAILGGRALDWLLDISAGATDREQAYREAESMAAAVPPGADGVSFLPFLGGQVAPERRPHARAGFAGLRLGHGRGAMTRALFEGVGFAVADIVDQVATWCGAPNRIRLTGGGAASPVWRQILADILDHAVEASDDAVEGRGAAIFLAVALGLYADYAAAAAAMVPPGQRVEPGPAAAAAYRDLRARWHVVRDTMRALDGLR
ncbi:MAG: FGGY-family carbohydrate kinase [Gammaproteobacteria bacterium]|nr:FGGY-family carbohydrate kinase [Gammaproteobacteria bacterium]